MNQLGYLDFDVLFEKSGEEYVVRVLNSPSGQASARFSLPFSPFEVENLLLRIGRTRKGVRRLESPEMEASRAFGSRLFSAVFDDEVLALLRSSLNTSYRKGMGLRLRMRLSQVPELLDLPWEFLFDPTRNQFLVLSVDTPLVRYLDLQQEVQPLAVTPPINVLAMIASPVDYPPLDVAHEWDKLNEALGDLIKKDLVSLTRLEKADLGSLQRALRRSRYHVFHFIGHGGFDSQAQDGVLLTEGESGRGRPVSGYDLGTLLHDHRSLRLAVLNACEGARTSLSDPFAGTAQSLVQNGIPAVIAMQFEITDPAAILLAHEFYGALADGYPVDAALAEARKAIFAQGNDVEWATPVLYLRTADAAIFQIEPPAPAAIPAEKPAREATPDEKPPEGQPAGAILATGMVVSPGGITAEAAPGVPTPEVRTSKTPDQVKAEAGRLYTQGLSAFWLDEWGQAIQSFEAVLQVQPDHAEAASRLETARRNLELDRLYREAQAAEVAGDWRAAGAALEQLVSLSPTYQDAQTRLATARLKCELVDLYAEARHLSQAGEWQAVVKVFEQIAALDPAVPDPEGLLVNAREQVAIQEKQAELETLYDRAVMALDAGHWEEAAGLLSKVQELQPGYEHSERLLARAEAELARAAVLETVQAAPQAAAGPAQVEAPAPPPAAPLPVETTEEPLSLQIRIESTLAGLAGEWQDPAQRALRPALWVSGGWLLSALFTLWIVVRLDVAGVDDAIVNLSNNALSYEASLYFFYALIAAALGGLALGIVLHRTALKLSRRHFLRLAGVWAVAGLLTIPFSLSGEVTTAFIFAWFLAGALGGWATYSVLRRAGARLDRQSIWLVILGWAIAMAFGTLIIQGDTSFLYFLGLAVEGFIGGLATFTAFFVEGKVVLQPDVVGKEVAAPANATESDRQASAPETSQAGAGSQAIGRTAALGKAILPSLWLAAGWFLASLAGLLFISTGLGGQLIELLKAVSGYQLEAEQAGYLIVVFFAGLLSGAAIGVVVGKYARRLTPIRSLVLAGAWALAYLMTSFFAYPFGGGELIIFSWFLAGALGGLATYALLPRSGVSSGIKTLILVTLGWAVALALGELLIQFYDQEPFHSWMHTILGDFADAGGRNLYISLGHAVEGFIGGLATFAVLYSLGGKNLGHKAGIAEVFEE